MVNDNIITQKMYHKVRGIIRGELMYLSCSECKRQDVYSFCDCLAEGGVCFKPRDEYVDKIARKICLAIGEPIEDLAESDKDTCNPKICKWCKYSNNGIRDPARSITMCDGCRYNEEFEHM